MVEDENEMPTFRLQELKKRLTSLKAKVETYERELQDFFNMAKTSLSWKPIDDSSVGMWLGQAGTLSLTRLNLMEKYEAAQRDYIVTLEEYIQVLDDLVKPSYEHR